MNRQDTSAQDAAVARLQALVDGSCSIVFFGGAGVSTESGIPDFRSPTGLYSQQFSYPPEQMLSHDFFVAHPQEFYRFYRRQVLALNARPNAAHHALAALEKAGKLDAVITQNIDGLHTAAGSRRVIELHGSVHRNTCLACGNTCDAAFVAGQEGLPLCSCGGLIKPDVVLYGEALDEGAMADAVRAIARADLLMIGGTSLAVWPAAGLIRHFSGPNLVVINQSPTDADEAAQLVINRPIGQVLGQLVTE